MRASSGVDVKRRACCVASADVLSFDAGAFGEHGFISTVVGVDAALRLGLS